MGRAVVACAGADGPAKLVHLTKAVLTEATLACANLREADLTKAKLIDATLTSVNLNRATLTQADLEEATLTNSLLNGAELGGAVLADARGLSKRQIEAAVIDSYTALPPYVTASLPPQAGPGRSDNYG
ncbi:pentapeptide repeat-containing protein [Streptomyces sp. G7(2002)]|uniref:pentapeptide repeat-containing protein n=1 Tax=Streptomyces sp. G7(2002) TaxID=2971798 RepID=UPI00237D820F|nr:pentapeptide repeat-containing protein [Streptomyces sp. G7(2002)]WDT55259.1 pentapeptide repeat-containing protein [Streptomyces sp. G7(2002)]